MKRITFGWAGTTREKSSHMVVQKKWQTFCRQQIKSIHLFWPSDATWQHISASTLDPINGLLSDNIKPLPEPKLTNHSWVHTHIYICSTLIPGLNSLKPSHTIWHNGTWSTLVQVMTCRLLTAPSNPWTNKCVVKWTLGNKRQWSLNQKTFFLVKIHLKLLFAKWLPFCSGTKFKSLQEEYGSWY